MSFQQAYDFLRQAGMEQRVRTFDVSSATVDLAAKALGCSPSHIAKTLSLRAGDRCVLIVAAGDTKIDNSKYKAQFGVKAKMLSPKEVEEETGYQVGGVCPFAAREGVSVYLDQSLRRFERVFPACGSSNSAVDLSVEELDALVKPAGWVDVCKIPVQE